MKKLIDFGEYTAKYKLPVDAVTVETKQPSLDINKPGLLMHGSLKDPYLILKLGLMSMETKYFKDFKSNPQICMGLNNTNQKHTIKANGSLKNTAVKYADYFSKDGVIYIISDEIKNFITYEEEIEDFGEYKRGNASTTESISSDFIIGVITENLPKAMAALYKAGKRMPVYTPDGVEYQMKN